MKKMIAIAVLAVAGALAVPTAANAAPTCTTQADYNLSVSENTAAPGAVVSAEACLYAGDNATLSFTGTGAGAPTNVQDAASVTHVVPASGLVTFKVTIPASATAGSVYTVTAADQHGDSPTKNITVVVTSGSGLPSTGVDATPYVIGGASLLAVGGIVVGLSFALRRRRQHAAA